MSENTLTSALDASLPLAEPAEFFQVGNEDIKNLRVYLRYSLFRNLDEFALRNTSQEQAGLLLGRHSADGNWSMVQEAIELKNVDSSLSDSLWREARKAASSRFPNLEVVGWFHSHPGTGVGVQPKETEIQKRQFGESWQVVYVMDPVVRERGFYLWDEGHLSFAGGFRIYGKEEKEEKMAPQEPARPDEHLRERYLERSMEKVLKTLRNPNNRPIDYLIVGLLVLIAALQLLRPAPVAKVDQSAVLEGQRAISQEVAQMGERVKAVEEHLSAVGMLDAELKLPETASKNNDEAMAAEAAKADDREKAKADKESERISASAITSLDSSDSASSPNSGQEAVSQAPPVLEAAGVRSGTKVMIHKVAPGDTISIIADKYYKTSDPKVCKALGRFNKLSAPYYDHIIPGDTLKIPDISKLGV